MTDSTVIRDIGGSLKALLWRGLDGQIEGMSTAESIKFKSPAEMVTSTSPELTIFLYKTIFNDHFRNIPPIPVGTDKMKKPPLVLDLHYIFIPYCSDTDKEMLMMENMMQTFYDHSVLKEGLLKGGLANSGNAEIRIVPQNQNLDELNKLWSIFPNKPFKLSTSCIVTPVRIPSALPDKDITRVVEAKVDVSQKKKG